MRTLGGKPMRRAFVGGIESARATSCGRDLTTERERERCEKCGTSARGVFFFAFKIYSVCSP